MGILYFLIELDYICKKEVVADVPEEEYTDFNSLIEFLVESQFITKEEVDYVGFVKKISKKEYKEFLSKKNNTFVKENNLLTVTA